MVQCESCRSPDHHSGGPNHCFRRHPRIPAIGGPRFPVGGEPLWDITAGPSVFSSGDPATASSRLDEAQLATPTAAAVVLLSRHGGRGGTDGTAVERRQLLKVSSDHEVGHERAWPKFSAFGPSCLTARTGRSGRAKLNGTTSSNPGIPECQDPLEKPDAIRRANRRMWSSALQARFGPTLR